MLARNFIPDWLWLCDPPSLAANSVVYFLIQRTIETLSLTCPFVYKVGLICYETLTSSLVLWVSIGTLLKYKIKPLAYFPQRSGLMIKKKWSLKRQNPELFGETLWDFHAVSEISALGFYVASIGSTTHNSLVHSFLTDYGQWRATPMTRMQWALRTRCESENSGTMGQGGCCQRSPDVCSSMNLTHKLVLNHLSAF